MSSELTLGTPSNCAGRLYFDGCCMVWSNGKLLAQGGQLLAAMSSRTIWVHRKAPNLACLMRLRLWSVAQTLSHIPTDGTDRNSFCNMMQHVFLPLQPGKRNPSKLPVVAGWLSMVFPCRHRTHRTLRLETMLDLMFQEEPRLLQWIWTMWDRCDRILSHDRIKHLRPQLCRESRWPWDRCRSCSCWAFRVRWVCCVAQVDFCCCHAAPLTIAESQPIEQLGLTSHHRFNCHVYSILFKSCLNHKSFYDLDSMTYCGTKSTYILHSIHDHFHHLHLHHFPSFSCVVLVSPSRSKPGDFYRFQTGSRPKIVGPMEEIAYGPSAWRDADLFMEKSRCFDHFRPGFGTISDAQGSADTFCRCPVGRIPRPPRRCLMKLDFYV